MDATNSEVEWTGPACVVLSPWTTTLEFLRAPFLSDLHRVGVALQSALAAIGVESADIRFGKVHPGFKSTWRRGPVPKWALCTGLGWIVREESVADLLSFDRYRCPVGIRPELDTALAESLTGSTDTTFDTTWWWSPHENALTARTPDQQIRIADVIDLYDGSWEFSCAFVERDVPREVAESLHVDHERALIPFQQWCSPEGFALLTHGMSLQPEFWPVAQLDRFRPLP